MTTKERLKADCNKQELRFSFFKLLLKNKSSNQVLSESKLCKNLNQVKK